MSSVTSLALTDVRCFEGTQRARLPRVTVLVGENSSGKSTFLGCLRGIAELTGPDELSDDNRFDARPFQMGDFATVARSGSARFTLEATHSGHRYDRVRVAYDEGPNGEPRERELYFRLAEDRSKRQDFFRVTRLPVSAQDGQEMWQVAGPGFEFEFEQSSVSYRQMSTWLSRMVYRGALPYDGNPALLRKRKKGLPPEAVRGFTGFVNFFRKRDPFPTPEQQLVIASHDPVGWKRKRAYLYNPFGPRINSTMLQEICELGRELKLFDAVEIRRGPIGEYEIWVNVSGKTYNLVDVGFGVQAVLPLLQVIASAPEGATILLQQPESHIHPQVQAALVRILVERRNRVVVETHSDHIPDWFRIVVIAGKLDPSDLGIVYFERGDDGASTTLHDIQVGKKAELLGTPPGFREFFLIETERLLGFRR